MPEKKAKGCLSVRSLRRAAEVVPRREVIADVPLADLERRPGPDNSPAVGRCRT